MLSNKLLFQNDQIEIYDEPCDGIYYRGVKSNNTYRSVLTYNIKMEVEMTEDWFVRNLFDVGRIVFLAAIQADEYTARKIITSTLEFELIYATSIGLDIPSDFNFPQHFARIVREEAALRPFVDLAKHRGLIYPEKTNLERNFTSFYPEVKRLCELYAVRLEYNGMCLKIHTDTLPLD